MARTHDVAPRPPCAAPRITVRHRIVLLVAVLAAAAGSLGLTVVPAPARPARRRWTCPGSPGWRRSPLSEVLVVHIQLQRDSHSFSMTDLVLVAGLYLLEPAALITAQVAGVGLVLVLHRRQFGMKLAFNLAAVRPAPAAWPPSSSPRSAATRRCPAPGTGSPRSPRSPSPRSPPAPASTPSCGSPEASPDDPRAAPHARPVAALRPRRRGRRPARRADRRAEPRLAGPARAAVRACSSPPTAPTPRPASSRTTCGCCTRSPRCSTTATTPPPR